MKKNKIKKNKYEEYLKSLCDLSEHKDKDGKHIDTECVHIIADDILCKLLIDLDCKEIVDVYQKLDKYYS